MGWVWVWGCGVRAELGGLLLDVRVLLVTPWHVGLAVGEEEEHLPKKERRTGEEPRSLLTPEGEAGRLAQAVGGRR